MDFRPARVPLHRPGKTNTKADILSRRANYMQGKNDNEGVIMLKDKWFIQLWDDDSAINDIMIKISQALKRLRDPEIVKELGNLEGVARLFIDHVFRDHGFPIKVISNRGTQFVSQFMKELYEALGIKGNPSTAYHPQMDGQTEQVNQEVKEFLMIFVNNKQDDWSEWLPIAQFFHNDQQHLATKHSPFFLNYGRHPRKGIEPLPTFAVPTVESLLKNITEARSKASTALKEAAERMK
ncbi:hypothetical protein AX14_003210, partial [Amanita brunnescens Koide BX004]